MSDFDPQVHPRAVDGRFAAKAVSEQPGGTDSLTAAAPARLVRNVQVSIADLVRARTADGAITVAEKKARDAGLEVLEGDSEALRDPQSDESWNVEVKVVDLVHSVDDADAVAYLEARVRAGGLSVLEDSSDAFVSDDQDVPMRSAVEVEDGTRYTENGWPLCRFCDQPATGRECLGSTQRANEHPWHYRCAEHRRRELAPGTVSGPVTVNDIAR